MKRLVLIDGMSVFYRGYFAMPGLSLPDGTPTGGVFGFASIAVEVIKKLDPDYVVVAWDKSKTATEKRKDIYPEYKAGRTRPPDDFFAQIPLLHDLLESFGWPLLEIDDYEADDIIGTISVEAKGKDIETCIVSGDYDMMQLLNGHVKVYITKKGSELIRFDDAAFYDKYGVHVKQFVDYKALVGDSSDNIPGVRGIGPKAAQSLLGEYGTLDGVYEHVEELKGTQKTKLEDGKESALMSRELARIFCDAPVTLDWKEADVNNTNLPAIAAKLKEFEFHSLIKRLPKHMQEEADTSLYFHESDEVNLTEVDWPAQPMIEGPIVLHPYKNDESDELWVSFTQTTISKKKIEDIPTSFWRAIELGIVVSYDVKELYHLLARHNVAVRFSEIHDMRQAAFLLDPLRRDRSLAGLIGGELADATQEIAATWQVYGWQVKAFDEKPKVQDIAKRFDFPLIYHLFMMEHTGIKLDPELLAAMSEDLGKKHAAA